MIRCQVPREHLVPAQQLLRHYARGRLSAKRRNWVTRQRVRETATDVIAVDKFKGAPEPPDKTFQGLKKHVGFR